MVSFRVAIALLSLATAAAAQPLPPAPPEAAAALQPWPYPPPNPQAWWTDDWPAPPEARDPLAGRRIDRWGRPTSIDNGVDPLLYRLWGLPPLQSQILYGDELVLEVWVRPARSVRQAVVRAVVRRDGRGFVQARAGLACCAPQIARRVDIDAELAPEAIGALRAVREEPLWSAARDVRVSEGGGAADTVCIDGDAFELTRLTARGAVSVRRACDQAEVGQAAAVLQAVLGAALGHDGRFDALFPNGAEFAAERVAYARLIAEGGALKPGRPRPAP